MGRSGLTRWEILRDQCAPPLPDTVYISDSLEAVKRLTPSATGHLVFCAGAAFDKTRLLNVWQGCVLLIRTDQQERIVRAIQEQFYVDSRKSAMSAMLLGVLTNGAGVQALVDAAYPFLKNPLVIFDSSYRIAGVTRKALQVQGPSCRICCWKTAGSLAGLYLRQPRSTPQQGEKEQQPHCSVP